jgi:hypothetical protein
MGRRIKIHYRGIQKLCPNCFGPHPKQLCQSRKKLWKEYVTDFKNLNPNIPDDLFGKWFSPNITNNTETTNNSSINNSSNMRADLQDTPYHQSQVAGRSNAVAVQHETSLTYRGVVDPVQPEVEPLIMAVTPGALLPGPTLASEKNVVTPEKRGDTDSEPKKADYLVPETRAEEDQMIDKLIQGGSLLGEAEQIIASRKCAFNKACREFKKSAGKPSKWVSKSQKGKNKKKTPGSHVGQMDVDYAN